VVLKIMTTSFRSHPMERRVPRLANLRARAFELARLPRAAKLGVVVIAAGLLVDAWVHTLGIVTAGTPAAAIVQQHLAHLVVLVGMVATLAGIVADGAGKSRASRPERSNPHALR
jgi:hypothetical protein